MPRQLGIQYPGAICHVMNRGDRREPIFHGDADRELFLETLGQACAKTEWLILAYCLMGNHFHLVVETPLGNLVDGMKWLLGTYPQYLKPAGRRPPWLRVERLLGEMRIPKDSPAGRRQFERSMEERRAKATGEEWKGLRRGWYLGDEAFRQELLEAAQAQVGRSHYGAERQETAEQRARRIVGEELQRRGWTAASLSQLRKGDAGKVQIARRLRAETTVTLQWNAVALAMGTWTHVANLLSHASLPA